MRTKAILITLLVTGVSIILLLLYFISLNRVPKSTGFYRSIKKGILKNSEKVNLKVNTYYIAGFSDHHLYLGNHTSAIHLLKFSNHTIKTLQLLINLPISESQISLSSNGFYIADLITYKLFSIDTKKLTLTDTIHKNGIFLDALGTTPGSVVLRDLDPVKQENSFLKKTMPGSTLRRSPLEKQIDGVFCTDGILTYDEKASLLVYVYYYRNQFLTLDTNLNVIQKHFTIDTVSKANIQVTRLQSSYYRQLSSPPLIINNQCSAFNHQLYIHSTRKGDNEDKAMFAASSVIDVYSLDNGAYEYSFYIPRNKQSRMRQFAVFEGKLYLLEGDQLLIYDMIHYLQF